MRRSGGIVQHAAMPEISKPSAPSHCQHVNLRAPRRRRRGLHTFRSLEPLGDRAKELPISDPLEDLHEERAAGAKRSDRERQGRAGEVERPRGVEGAGPGQLRARVAHHDVGGLLEGFEDSPLVRWFREIPAEELDALQRSHANDVGRNHAPLRSDPFACDLRPSAWRRAEVHDDVALAKEAVAEVNLGKLDCGSAAVGLLLRSAVEAVVPPSLDPCFPHRGWHDAERRP